MAISFLAINAYKARDRVVVQYFDSGSQDECLCPECGWRGSISEKKVRDGACMEIVCPQCTTALAMISSRIQGGWGDVRCL